MADGLVTDPKAELDLLVKGKRWLQAASFLLLEYKRDGDRWQPIADALKTAYALGREEAMPNEERAC